MMILYLRIATDIPAGTAITTRYIMDKYKVSRSTSRNALAVLAHIGAAEEISRIHTEGTAYSLSPDAADMAERGFVSAHNRLFMALAAKRREMKQSCGVMA
ncbi:TPA: hypothetical protein OT882_000838 [Morganella morganii]|nr:hypothetical protein [Morganella morganii]